MRIRQDLPIEEQERLQREYMEMSNRPLATLRPLGSRTGLDSMFNDLGQPILRPADQAAPTKDIYDSWTSEQKSEWDRYGEFGKPQLIDMPRPPVMLPLPGQENPYPVDPIRPEVMPRPGMPRPEVTPRPDPQHYIDTPDFRPLPQQPTIEPKGWTGLPPGGMPRPGRGRGFLNRFERLLDGLEGLVGKLGGESPEDTSPLVDPAGGIGGLTPTPFTASQDY